MGAGYYGLSAKELAPKRDKILKRPDVFRDITTDLKAHNLFFSPENTLLNMPRGYSEYKDHELADYLKLKNFIVRKSIKKTDWYDSEFVKRVSEFTRCTTAMIQFFRNV